VFILIKPLYPRVHIPTYVPHAIADESNQNNNNNNNDNNSEHFNNILHNIINIRRLSSFYLHGCGMKYIILHLNILDR